MKIFRSIIRGWMAVGKAIGWVVSHLVLFIVYCLVFIPVSLALRVARYDPMKRRLLPEAESYWIERHTTPDRDFKPERCEHMY